LEYVLKLNFFDFDFSFLHFHLFDSVVGKEEVGDKGWVEFFPWELVFKEVQ
jgi:hypothetical protein